MKKNSLIVLFIESESQNWASFSSECSIIDASAMTFDFESLTGVTPSSLFQTEKRVPRRGPNAQRPSTKILLNSDL